MTMQRSWGWSLILFALALLAPRALAQHPFSLSVSSGSASLSPAPVLEAEGWRVSITSTGTTPAVMTLTTSEADTAVAFVLMYCGPDTTLSILETSTGTFDSVGLLFKPQPQPDSGFFLIDEIVITGSMSYDGGWGGITADSVRRIDLGGDLLGNVLAGNYDDEGAPDGWELEEVLVGGRLDAQFFVAKRGRIGRLIVEEEIGWALFLGARDGIREVQCAEMNETAVVAYFDGIALGEGTLSRFVTTTGGVNSSFGLPSSISAIAFVADSQVPMPEINIAGDADCSIQASINSEIPITIGGSFPGDLAVRTFAQGSGIAGDVTIHGDLTGTILAQISGGVRTLIRIGGVLADGAEIKTPNLAGGGSVGQIIINALADEGAWVGDVIVNSTTLSPVPHYTDEDLIGAVGQVPFHLHDGDCIPENGGTAVVNAFFVRLAFYGPVTSESDLPFNIWWRPTSGGSWTLDNANWTVNSGLGTRMIDLLYFDNTDPSVIPADREYLIEPILTGEDALLCDKLLTTEAVPVGDFEYTFFTP